MIRAAEKMTDHIIYAMMTNVGIKPEPEKTQILEVQNALKTASKRLTGNAGKPERANRPAPQAVCVLS